MIDNSPLESVKSQINIEFDNSTQAKIIYDSIILEFQTAPDYRSSMNLTLDDNIIIIDIDAQDSTSFRASVNSAIKKALEELKKTDENTEVFKQAGNLLIKVDYKEALDDAEDKLETLKLRKQTMARQEERVMKKLEEMQSTIQAAMQGMAPNGA